MASPVHVGIWGLGYAGRGMFIREIQEFPGMFQITAGCDTVEENLAAAGAQVPGIKRYSNAADLLRDPEVELVAIATRSVDHVSHALMALAAGKTVFVEKPIAVDAIGERELAGAVEKYPGRVYFRHNRRFEPQFQCVQKICRSGVLGSIYEIKLHRHSFLRYTNWQNTVANGGGHVNNWGPHLIDHALILLESPVVNLWSDLQQVLCTGDAEDHARILLTGENGRVVDVEISCGVALAQPEYVIFGSEGSLTCSGIHVTLKHLAPDQGTSPPFAWVERSFPVELEKVDHPKHIWKHLHAAIREGRDFPITPTHALEVVRICNAVKAGTRFELVR